MTHPSPVPRFRIQARTPRKAHRPPLSPLGGDANSSSRGLNGEGTGPLARKIIYFDFDKSEIKPEFADIVTATARILDRQSQSEDETRGQHRRARHPRIQHRFGRAPRTGGARALMLQGVAESQVNTVSFGAERPAVEGDDEAAWAKNRRVEVVYLP